MKNNILILSYIITEFSINSKYSKAMAKFPRFLVSQNEHDGITNYYLIHTLKPQFLAKYTLGENISVDGSLLQTKTNVRGRTVNIDVLKFFGDAEEIKNIDGLMKRTCDWLHSYLVNN